MKIGTYLFCLLLFVSGIYTNLKSQNQNGLNIIQVEKSPIIFNSITRPTSGADSCIVYNWENRRIEGYRYIRNDKGQLKNVQFGFISHYTQAWWKDPLYEYVLDFNEKGNLIQEEFYDYSQSNAAISKVQNIYNEDGVLIEQMTLTAKIVFTYNQSKQLVRENSYNLNSQNQWDTSRSYCKMLAYDENGSLSKYQVGIVDADNNFVTGIRYLKYDYDNNNYVKKLEDIKWNNETADWDDGNKRIVTTYTNIYDSEDRLSSSEASIYNFIDDSFVEKTATDYEYNERGEKVSVINYRFDSGIRGWIPTERVLTDYDANSNIILHETTIWNEEKEQWCGQSNLPAGELGFGRREWTFDANNDITSAKYYKWNNYQFVLDRSLVYHNFERTTGVGDSPSNQNVSAFMQNGVLFINSPQVEEVSLYSVTRQKMQTIKKDAGQASMTIYSYPQGVFIVKGSSGWTRKISF